MNAFFFDELSSKLTDDLPKMINVIENSVRDSSTWTTVRTVTFLVFHSLQIDFQRSIRDNHIVFIDPTDPDLEQCKQLFSEFDQLLTSHFKSSAARSDSTEREAAPASWICQ